MDKRKVLLLFAAVLLLQTVAYIIKYGMEVHAGHPFGSDFGVFWHAAQQLAHGDWAAIYNVDFLRNLTYSQAAHIDIFAPFVYPPYFLLLLFPFGYLSYTASVIIFSTVTVLFYYGLLIALIKRHHADSKLSLIIAIFVMPAAAANLFSGQTAALIATSFLAALYFWQQKPLTAGVGLSIVAFKPQLSILTPFVLLVSAQWKILCAAALCVAGLLLASAAVLGTALWKDFFSTLTLFGHVVDNYPLKYATLAVSPYTSLHALGWNTTLVSIVQLAVSIYVGMIVLQVFHNGAEKLDAFALLACGALLASPYAACYDTPVLAPAFISLALHIWNNPQGKIWDSLLLMAVAMIPYAQPMLAAMHISYGLIVLCVLFLYLQAKAKRQTTSP